MKKRITALLLAVCLIVPLFVVPTNAASNDYTTWSQGDPAWNQAEAWPASQYPDATSRTMKDVGCAV